ncbi:MAG: MFS transporter [Verrucomicrobia bacterium]|nr:MFS transporter [Verrucomicrobiota bacterium]
MTIAASVRPASWKWWICGLLLFASTINYMDRQTLANAAVRITDQFHLSQEQYGNLELVFGWAFAVGSMTFGILADRFSVRWLYPIVLALWSVVGFATGLVESYENLLVCRTLLGLFEGGHWPCAIKTTQRLLESKDRAMGNGVLQSGTSIGAIITPLVMRALLTNEPGSWRLPFQLVGAIGFVWIIFWLAMVRKNDLSPIVPSTESLAGVDSGDDTIWKAIFSRRMLVLFFVVACINTCWQTLRAWLPKFLQQGRGYAEADALYFNSLFYVATDVGCIGAGALTFWLARRGRSVHGSRSVVFFGCAALAALTTLAAGLPKGWLLLGVLLLVGAGALGVFPIYHALTQELSAQHQGKVTGITGVAAWVFAPPAQKFFGRLIDRTDSFDLGLALAGWLPLLAFAALWLFWNQSKNSPAPSV